MRTLSRAEARSLATSLKRWAERPIRRANLRAAGISVVTIAFTVTLAYETPDPASAVRGMAILFAAFQSVAHVVTTGVLRALGSLGWPKPRRPLPAIAIRGGCRAWTSR